MAVSQALIFDAGIRYGEAVFAMLLPVIRNVQVVIGLDGDGTLGDFHRAILDHEGDLGEVGIVISEILRHEVHLIGANVDADNLILFSFIAQEGEVVHGIQLIIDSIRIAGDLLFLAVVDIAAALFGDGNNHGVKRGHFQYARNIGDSIVGGYI